MEKKTRNKVPRDFWAELSTGRRRMILTPLFGVTVNVPAIIVTPSRESEDRLDTFVHEVLHASLPEMSEAEVVRVAKDIAGVLWKAGYRRPKT